MSYKSNLKYAFLEVLREREREREERERERES